MMNHGAWITLLFPTIPNRVLLKDDGLAPGGMENHCLPSHCTGIGWCPFKFFVSVTPTVTAVNDAPVLSGAGGTLAYTENDGPKVIDAVLTITDEDDANIESATITISSGFQSSEDVLAFTDTNDVSSWNGSTGVLTLSGSATKAQYEAAADQSLTATHPKFKFQRSYDLLADQ